MPAEIRELLKGAIAEFRKSPDMQRRYPTLAKSLSTNAPASGDSVLEKEERQARAERNQTRSKPDPVQTVETLKRALNLDRSIEAYMRATEFSIGSEIEELLEDFTEKLTTNLDERFKALETKLKSQLHSAVSLLLSKLSTTRTIQPEPVCNVAPMVSPVAFSMVRSRCNPANQYHVHRGLSAGCFT